MTKCCALLVAILVATSASTAQTVTADVLPFGSANSYVTSNYAAPVTNPANPPAGPAAFGTVWQNGAQHQQSYANSVIKVENLALAPQALLGFSVTGRSVAVSNPPAGPFTATAGSSMSGSVRMTMTAPTAVGGRLFLNCTGSIGGLATSEIHVDLEADGTIDHSVDASTFFSGEWREREFPVVLGPTPYLVDLHFVHACGTSSVNGQSSAEAATAQIDVQFFAGQPAVELFDASGAHAAIVWQHAPDDTVTIGVGATGLAGGVIVIGVQPTSVTITPWVTQLVSIDAVIWQPSASFTLPPLPPGTELFCQGLAWDAGGWLRSTPSLRAWLP